MAGGRAVKNSPLYYTNAIFRLYVCPPVQEEGDGGILSIEGRPMEGRPSTLQQGQTKVKLTNVCICINMEGSRVT